MGINSEIRTGEFFFRRKRDMWFMHAARWNEREGMRALTTVTHDESEVSSHFFRSMFFSHF